jgi:CMP/dCMP kinase
MAVITISRMYGSGGSEVAALIARSLGWELYDNAVVDAVAERLGLPRAAVSERDERVPSIVERLATTLSLATPESMPLIPDAPLPSEELLVRVTKRVIEEAVQRGPAVFVGRGAQSLLAQRADALHVFCHAPRAFLVEYAIQHHRVASHEAERHVAEMNRQREQYVKRHWSRNWLHPENYHLCVNTGWLGISGCAELVTEIARKRFGPVAAGR